jgi:hypothetical protein
LFRTSIRLRLFIFLLISGMGATYGQSYRAYLSKQLLRQDDELLLYLEVKNPVSALRPQFPLLEGLRKQGASQELRPQSGSLIVYSQAYSLEDTGRFKIPPFEVLGGDSVFFTSPELPFRVLPPLPRADFEGEMPELDLEIKLSKTRVYLGEGVQLDILLVMKEEDREKVKVSDLARAELRESLPRQAFWEEKIGRQPQMADTLVKNGKRYLAFPLFRTYLFPLQTGDIAFDGLYLPLQIEQQQQGASTYDILTGKNKRRVPLILKASPTKLQVQPLPNHPRRDSAAVGVLGMDARLSAPSVNTGEPFYLTLTLSGIANFSTLNQPQLKLPDAFSRQEPAVSYSFKFSDGKARGQRSFTYELVAAYAGAYELGPVRYFYFDPIRGQYDSLLVQYLSLEVEGKDLPELLEDGQRGFYARMLQKASRKPPFRIPFGPWLSLLLVGASIALLVWIWKRNG